MRPASPFIIREEYFGGTGIRRNNLTFSFLNDWQYDFLKKIAVTSLAEAIDLMVNKRISGNGLADVSPSNPAPVSRKQLEDFVNEKKSVGMLDKDGRPAYELRQSNEKKEELPHGVLKSPLRLYFESTRLCNLRCKNCFSASGMPYPDELSHGEVMAFLDKLRQDDVLEVRITGGEPTQRPGWQEIVAHAKDLGLAVSLNTNGIYNRPSTRDEILSLGVDQVIISLDGNKAAHESLRGEGSYAKTLSTIKYLSERANNVRINTILKDETLPLIPEMVKMADELKTEMCFILLRPVGRGMEIAKAIPSIERLHQGILKVKELRKEYKNVKIMTSYDVIQANANKPTPDLDLTGCSAGLRGMGVSSRGRAECCGFLAELTDEYSLGNIRDFGYSVLPIWRESQKMKKFRELNLQQNRKCTSCKEYEDRCFGTCAVMSVYKDVNPARIDPYCVLHN